MSKALESLRKQIEGCDPERPSEAYDLGLRLAVVEGVTKSLASDLDWRFADNILKRVSEYLKQCSMQQGDLPVTLEEVGGEFCVSVDIFKEGDVAFSLGSYSLKALVEARANSWSYGDEDAHSEMISAAAAMFEKLAKDLRATNSTAHTNTIDRDGYSCDS